MTQEQEVTASKLLGLMRQLTEHQEMVDEAKEIKKDLVEEAKSMGISSKTLAAVYKAYSNPDRYRTEQGMLDDLLRQLNI